MHALTDSPYPHAPYHNLSVSISGSRFVYVKDREFWGVEDPWGKPSVGTAKVYMRGTCASIFIIVFIALLFPVLSPNHSPLQHRSLQVRRCGVAQKPRR